MNRLAPRIATGLFCVSWMALSLTWLTEDRIVRDGDEQYIVETASQYADRLVQGDLRGFFGSKDPIYPPLYSAAVGVWWSLTGGGQPGRPAVRFFGILCLALAAWATGRLARRAFGSTAGSTTSPSDLDLAEAVTFALVLVLPLANGMSRHFMIEGALTAAVAVTVLCAARAGERPSYGRALILGLTLGAGCLLKQTYLLYALAPALFAARRQRWLWLLTLGVAALIASPWYLRGMGDQLAYASHSLAPGGDLRPTDPYVFYPVVLARRALGPVLAIALAAAAIWALRSPRRTRMALGAIWLLVDLLVLIVVSKKYPRLVVPITPAAALCVGVALAHAGRWRWAWSGGLVALSVAWLTWTSWNTLPALAMVERVSRCDHQYWLRAPQPDDLGLAEVAAFVQEHPDREVLVIGGPTIPPQVQTTLHWAHHLRWYLRFEGLTNLVYDDQEPPPHELATPIVIEWGGSTGDVVDVPSLETYFTLGGTSAPDRS